MTTTNPILPGFDLQYQISPDAVEMPLVMVANGSILGHQTQSIDNTLTH
ncbi:MAG: hypothetical protein JOY85_24975 [Acidobacteriaceae bacterium]|nr:hypothetical protein [Acidobacteriaceae bacterium]